MVRIGISYGSQREVLRAVEDWPLCFLSLSTMLKDLSLLNQPGESMSLKMLALSAVILTGHVMAYSTLDCNSSHGVSYISHNKVGGARPFPGMITHIEEIQKNNQVVYRVVNREECYQDSFCNVQQPELVDIISPDFSFQFLTDTKLILASEGDDMGPVKKETYAIKFVSDKEVWMICDSYLAFYP